MFDEFLPDIVSSEDLFKNEAHKAISEEIFNIITSKNCCGDGFPIGLVGEWGSGKSTIVNMLMKSLEKEENYFVYYVDSWAHEGDQLRRSFLKKLIAKTKKEYENKTYKKYKKEYKKYKEKLENLDKKNSYNLTVTKSRHSITLFGLIFLFFTALVPIGAALVESVAEDVTFIWGGALHPKFFTGALLCAGFAFLILLFIPIKILYKKIHKNKNFKEEKKWRFDFIDEETTDFSQEEERSSVEFEEYFEETLDVLKHMGKTDFVCVIDNIDRISCDEALEIWSTLQVFMKYKNPWFEKNESLKNVENNGTRKRPFRIWTIIPYAESQIKKIWEKDNDNSNIAEHFFSKMFLLRIDVPELMLSDWKDFAANELEKKFSIFSSTQKKNIIKVLQLVKGNTGDYPTPREIKNYLNQVAYLYSVFGKQVSIESICYFVHLRHFKSLSIEDIRKSLVKNELPDNKMNFFNRKEVFINDLTMMIFRAAKKGEKYLLLTKPIASALEKRDYQALKNLAKNHGENFKNVLDQLLRLENSSATSWIYCLEKAKFSDANIKESLSNFAEINIEVLKAEIFTMDVTTAGIIFKVLKDENKIILLKTYFNLFCENFKIENSNKNELLEKLAGIEKIFGGKPPCSLDYSELRLEGLKAVIQFNNEKDANKKLHIESYLSVPKTADQDLYDALIDNKWLVPELPGIARILALAANFVLKKSRDIIESLFTAESKYAELYLQCLYELSVKKYEKSDAFIFTERYWQCIFNLTNNKLRVLEAVCLFFINYEIFKGNANSLYDEIFLKLENIFRFRYFNDFTDFNENAAFVFNRLNETGNLEVLWETLEDNRLALGWKCLDMAITNKKIKKRKSEIFQKRKEQLELDWQMLDMGIPLPAFADDNSV